MLTSTSDQLARPGAFWSLPQSPEPERAGVRTAILGSLWTIADYHPVSPSRSAWVQRSIWRNMLQINRINRLIQTNINNLAGVPSIIYGMLGLAIFVRAWNRFTSGAIFGFVDPTTANGRTIISGRSDPGLAGPAVDHHQRPGSDQSSSEFAAAGQLWDGRHRGRRSGIMCCPSAILVS